MSSSHDRMLPVVPTDIAFPVVPAAQTAKCRFPDGDITEGKDTAPIALAAQDTIFVGFDTEWARDPKRRLANIILAYGLFLVCGEKSVSLIVEPRGSSKSHRLSLKRLIGLIIQKAVQQGILDGWPKSVYLAVHFGRGDFAACSDFKLLKPQLDAVRGTLVTKSRPIALDIDIDEKSGLSTDVLPQVPRRLVFDAIDRCGNGHRLRVRVLDTYCLAPEGASLNAIGSLVGYGKLELPAGYDPSAMASFRAERPDEFSVYLLRDAEITARYAQRFARFSATDLGLSHPPGTLGAAAVMLFLDELKKAGVDRQRLFGLTTQKTLGYSRKLGRRCTMRQDALSFASGLIDKVASDAYSGGRTETYMTGPVGGHLLRDIDLRSAYPSAMAAIGLPDYEACEIVRDDGIERFHADTLGIAEVEFDTPAELRFPVIGVRTERGLIFPLRGTTVATAPEIAAARHLGVAVRIKTGVIIPWDLSVKPYELFVVKMLKLRESLKKDRKDTLESKTVKVMTNSLYGKTAQGVRAQSVYDMRHGASKPLARSAVTGPAFAAYTTGLVRAVIAELLNSIPAQHIVVSVSTDGFLTSSPVEDIRLDGPATRVLLAARRRISDQTS